MARGLTSTRERYRATPFGMEPGEAWAPGDVDALVLVTEWQDYRELNWEAIAGRMRTPLILDGRNALDRPRLERFGFRYLGIAG
jgi:UDP-glucose 6-dehydrogenase